MLEPAKFIIYWATSNTEAALKALGSREAARVRVALRLAERGSNVRLGSVLYALAERAKWLEQMGVDRITAVEQLVAEFRLRIEERLSKIRQAYNTVVFSASMVYLTSIVVLILGVLSEAATTMAWAMALMALSLGLVVEGLVPPVRRWDYRITILAMLPAAVALFWKPAVYVTAPVAVSYGIWYWRLRREAEEEFIMAIRGRLQTASTDLAKEALEIQKAVKMAGTFYIQAAAEHLLRIVWHYYSSIRTDGLIRAGIILSLVGIAVMAISQVYMPLTEIVEKAKQAEAILPVKFYAFDPGRAVVALGFVAAVLAGRVAESYAMAPLFTPVMLLALLV